VQRVMVLSMGREIPIDDERGIGLFLKKLESCIVRWLPGNNPAELVPQQRNRFWCMVNTGRKMK